jgi:hypothetical protein
MPRLLDHGEGDVIARPGYGAGALFIAIAGGFVIALERTYGARRYVPYLDELRR